MGEVVTVGLDIAKSVFQVHAVDAVGQVVVQRKLSRAKLLPFFEKLAPCLIGIEACATAHHWGRRLTELGHEVKLMPPSYVKPYLKRQKNDAADAEAGRRRPSRHPLRRATWDQAPLARAANGPTNDEDRGRRAGQQNRPYDLGDHDQRRGVPGAYGASRIRDRAPRRRTSLGRATKE
jgi:transposase